MDSDMPLRLHERQTSERVINSKFLKNDHTDRFPSNPSTVHKNQKPLLSILARNEPTAGGDLFEFNLDATGPHLFPHSTNLMHESDSSSHQRNMSVSTDQFRNLDTAFAHTPSLSSRTQARVNKSAVTSHHTTLHRDATYNSREVKSRKPSIEEVPSYGKKQTAGVPTKAHSSLRSHRGASPLTPATSISLDEPSNTGDKPLTHRSTLDSNRYDKSVDVYNGHQGEQTNSSGIASHRRPMVNTSTGAVPRRHNGDDTRPKLGVSNITHPHIEEGFYLTQSTSGGVLPPKARNAGSSDLVVPWLSTHRNSTRPRSHSYTGAPDSTLTPQNWRHQWPTIAYPETGVDASFSSRAVNATWVDDLACASPSPGDESFVSITPASIQCPNTAAPILFNVQRVPKLTSCNSHTTSPSAVDAYRSHDDAALSQQSSRKDKNDVAPPHPPPRVRSRRNRSPVRVGTSIASIMVDSDSTQKSAFAQNKMPSRNATSPSRTVTASRQSDSKGQEKIYSAAKPSNKPLSRRKNHQNEDMSSLGTLLGEKDESAESHSTHWQYSVSGKGTDNSVKNRDMKGSDIVESEQDTLHTRDGSTSDTEEYLFPANRWTRRAIAEDRVSDAMMHTLAAVGSPFTREAKQKLSPDKTRPSATNEDDAWIKKSHSASTSPDKSAENRPPNEATVGTPEIEINDSEKAGSSNELHEDRKCDTNNMILVAKDRKSEKIHSAISEELVAEALSITYSDDVSNEVASDSQWEIEMHENGVLYHHNHTMQLTSLRCPLQRYTTSTTTCDCVKEWKLEQNRQKVERQIQHHVVNSLRPGEKTSADVSINQCTKQSGEGGSDEESMEIMTKPPTRVFDSVDGFDTPEFLHVNESGDVFSSGSESDSEPDGLSKMQRVKMWKLQQKRQEVERQVQHHAMTGSPLAATRKTGGGLLPTTKGASRGTTTPSPVLDKNVKSKDNDDNDVVIMTGKRSLSVTASSMSSSPTNTHDGVTNKVESVISPVVPSGKKSEPSSAATSRYGRRSLVLDDDAVDIVPLQHASEHDGNSERNDSRSWKDENDAILEEERKIDSEDRNVHNTEDPEPETPPITETGSKSMWGVLSSGLSGIVSGSGAAQESSSPTYIHSSRPSSSKLPQLPEIAEQKNEDCSIGDVSSVTMAEDLKSSRSSGRDGGKDNTEDVWDDVGGEGSDSGGDDKMSEQDTRSQNQDGERISYKNMKKKLTLQRAVSAHHNEEVDPNSNAGLLAEGARLLKIGRNGKATERLVRLEQNRYLVYPSSIFSMKFRSRNIVDLETVTRLQKGQTTLRFDKTKARFSDRQNLSFSLVLTSGHTCCFIALDHETFDLWYSGIEDIVKRHLVSRSEESADVRFFRAKWDLADEDGDGTLSKREVIKLVSSMNVHMSRKDIIALYAQVDEDNSDSLNFEEFCTFMHLLRRRSEMVFIWATVKIQNSYKCEPFPEEQPVFMQQLTGYMSVDDCISVEEFVSFWEKSQNQKLTDEEAVEVIEDVMKVNFKELNETPVLSFDGFCSILSGSFNVAFDAYKQTRYQSSRHPISHYFIACSHNTYLTGDQLKSASTVSRYIDDLCRGCRCVELDCWDGDDGRPVVYHGFTLTSKILFEDVITAIAHYSFRTSEYPVILSLEVHCSLTQQKVMASIMKREFGAHLLLPGQYLLFNKLPTLHQLRRRIILKGKRPTSLDAMFEDARSVLDGFDEDDDNGFSEMNMTDEQKTALQILNESKKQASESQHVVNTQKDLGEILYLAGINVKKLKLRTVTEALPADLIISTSESILHDEFGDDETMQRVIVRNRDTLSRVYPKGTRINSSNYDPLVAWAMGHQLVALNYQTGGIQMHLNNARFKQNGQLGYVLKPEYLLDDAATQSPPQLLTIHVISGQQLPKPNGAHKGEVIDPYILVSIEGATVEPSTKYRTKTVKNNGFNPYWNEVFKIKVTNPDLDQLYLQVKDEDDINPDSFIAYSAIPMDCLSPGYRTFELYDFQSNRDGDFAFASLFCRVSLEPWSEDMDSDDDGGGVGFGKRKSKSFLGKAMSIRSNSGSQASINQKSRRRSMF